MHVNIGLIALVPCTSHPSARALWLLGVFHVLRQLSCTRRCLHWQGGLRALLVCEENTALSGLHFLSIWKQLLASLTVMCPFLILPWWDLGAPVCSNCLKGNDWEPSGVVFQGLQGTLPPHKRHHFLFVLFSGTLRCGTTVPTPPSSSWAPNLICGMTRTRLKSWRRRSWLPSPIHRALPWQKRSVWGSGDIVGCVCGRPCTLIKWNAWLLLWSQLGAVLLELWDAAL